MKSNWTRINWASFLALLLIWGTAGVAWGQDLVFQTGHLRFVAGSDGTGKSLTHKDFSQEWLASKSMPLAAITKAGKAYPITSLRRKGEIFEADFGQAEAQADYRITIHPKYLVFELMAIRGHGVEEVKLLQLQPVAFENNGEVIACRWNDKFAVCQMSLSDRVNSGLEPNNLISSSAYADFNLPGEKVALIAAPASDFLKVVQEVEKDYGLPSPRIGGYWAKQSPDVQTNYLFTDLTEANVDQTIEYARIGNFKYLLIFCSTWATSPGSYEINRTNFPRGEDSLKATIDKCHAAGLKVGMHMMTSLIAKTDPLVCPIPDPRLLKEAEATLDGELNSNSREIVAAKGFKELTVTQPLRGIYPKVTDIQIDNEIINCDESGSAKSNTFSGCVRGHAGTQAAPHPAGSKMYRLAERYGFYLADLKTSLKEQIASRVAELINNCGFDMVYFDGGEVDGANGPRWYWVGQLQMSVLKQVQRELLVQGSGITHWTWHVFTRGTCEDYAALWTAQWLDFKVGMLRFFQKDFRPAELGWWGLLDSAYDHAATVPEEIEALGMCMLAYDVPVSIETNLRMLQNNGRTEEILSTLRHFDHLRQSGRISWKTRRKLRHGEWQMVRNGDNIQFYPVHSQINRMKIPSEINFFNPERAQPLKFRLTVLPSFAEMEDSANIVLLGPERPHEIKLPETSKRESG